MFFGDGDRRADLEPLKALAQRLGLVVQGQSLMPDRVQLVAGPQSEEALSEMWTEQIKIGSGIGYGLGWMLRDWQGQRVIEHGGNVDGFAAQMALHLCMQVHSHCQAHQPLPLKEMYCPHRRKRR